MQSPPPNYGDKLIGAIARGVCILLSSKKEAWLTAVNSFVAVAVTDTVTMIQTNFPKQSFAERTLSGPVLTLLKNCEPAMESAITGAIDAMYNNIVTTLDNRAKATNI